MQGIAITATSITLESGDTLMTKEWQYSTDGGTTWLNIGAVSDSQALLLRSTDLVRFLPDAKNGNTGSITFRAWDQTSGTAGTKVDVSTNGGTTAFSTATASSAITVADVNNAPVLDPAQTQPFTTITEDDVNNPGNTVASLFGGAKRCGPERSARHRHHRHVDHAGERRHADDKGLAVFNRRRHNMA